MTTTQQYRRRNSSSATLLSNLPHVRRMEDVVQGARDDRREEEDDFENGQEPDSLEELNNSYADGTSEDEEMATDSEGNEWGTDHTTRIGTPDRRFRENRALTEEDVGSIDYRRASRGRLVAGVHITSDGTPDRRYKENRALSDDQIEIIKAELILSKHGITKSEISPVAILAKHAADYAPTRTNVQQQESPLSRVAKASGTRHKAQRQGVPQKATGTNGHRR